MNVLDLFSGIGAFSLGLERAGMRTLAFCESDDFCRRVLAKHWPDVPVWRDIRTLTAQALADTLGHALRNQPRRGNGASGADPAEPANDGPTGIDLICGGFPCQDISVAGKGAGIEGSRSGLWTEFARIIGEVRPRYVIVENVAALLGRGLDRVLGDLAALGFDAEWHCIPASAVGAPHRRDRVWIVAHPDRGRREIKRESEHSEQQGASWHIANGFCEERRRRGEIARSGWWATEPDVGRVVDGPAAQVDRRARLIALGNALVPQIPEIIGRAIMDIEHPYDLHDDVNKSLKVCYDAIRKRKAKGGPGWPK
jgi:DNA (cytosine-5)-methyltransferase 1